MSRDIEGEIDHLDKMIVTLVEMLEEKNIVGYGEWKSCIRRKLKMLKD